MEYRYLGIDPSLTSPGIVLLRPNDRPIEIALKPPSRDRRLAWLHRAAGDIIIKYGTPAFAVLEGPSLGSVGRTSDLGMAYGIFRLLMEQMHIPHVIASPKEIKKFGAGRGGATKAAMVETAVADGCSSVQEDICDAWHMARLAQGIHEGRSPKLTRASDQVVYNLLGKQEPRCR